MRRGKRSEANPAGAFSSNRPATNKAKRSLLVVLLIVVTAALIVWVFNMGRKATETVEVVMTSQPIYKNQTITETMLQPYTMIKAEFEKYSIADENGTVHRRLLLWDERNLIIGAFAAFPIQANVTPDYRCFYTYRVDNSDAVLYSFPGKEIVSFNIAEGDLSAFKTFLRPGDRIIITGIYTDEESVDVANGDGFNQKEKVQTFRSEVLFQDIMIADILNAGGESVLDMYEDYNNRTVQEQAALDASTAFKDATTPSTLLVALTPEEKDMYYYYLSKGDVEFRMTLPQRIE